ncbi:MAG: hypothetical protein Q9227_005855 [Pyrenula ochraceoflavens]
MSDNKLTVSILIVSDTAFQDPSSDKAADVLLETFSLEGGERWWKPRIDIVPDDVLEIQRHIRERTDGSDPANLILTTGGTGFAVKDHTPESVKPSRTVFDRNSIANGYFNLTSTFPGYLSSAPPPSARSGVSIPYTAMQE